MKTFLDGARVLRWSPRRGDGDHHPRRGERPVLRRAHVGWKGTRTLQCRELKAEPARPGEVILLDVDGEQPGRLPCRMRIIPSAIRLKVW